MTVSYVDDRETFFSPDKDTAMSHGMTAQYLNEVVDKRNGLAVVDRDGDVWGWVYDCHKDVGKWVCADTHDGRVGRMADGEGSSRLSIDYEPYRDVASFPAPSNPFGEDEPEGFTVERTDYDGPRTEHMRAYANGGTLKDESYATREEVADRLNHWGRVAKKTTTSDPVSPAHYQGFSNGAEVIDITENLTFNTGNATKYLSRAGRIDGQNKGAILEDLRKAAWYVAREIERIETQK